MMSPTLFRPVVLASVLLFQPLVFGQTYAPWVSLRITAPDGEVIERSARDGQVASVTLKDGATYEFRPTIHDEPFSKVTVAVFSAATATAPTALLGEVTLLKGGAAAELKSKPNFKIAVSRIQMTLPAQSS